MQFSFFHFILVFSKHMTVSMVRVRSTGEDPGVGGGGAAPETAPASPAQGGPDHQVPPRRPHVRKNEADSD